jgi:hypothetical protein
MATFKISTLSVIVNSLIVLLLVSVFWLPDLTSLLEAVIPWWHLPSCPSRLACRG